MRISTSFKRRKQLSRSHMQSPFDFSREDEEKEIVVRKFNLKKKLPEMNGKSSATFLQSTFGNVLYVPRHRFVN